MNARECHFYLLDPSSFQHSSGSSTYSRALCIRYLGGILDLPGFWSGTGSVHSDVASKLCCLMSQVLRDIGVDILALGPAEESEPPFDYDGVDFLATTILTGLLSWLGKLDREDWALQSWFEYCCEFVQLLLRCVQLHFAIIIMDECSPGPVLKSSFQIPLHLQPVPSRISYQLAITMQS